MQEKQIREERLKVKGCKEKGNSLECPKWGPGQGSDRQEGRRRCQLSLSFQSLPSGIWSAKCDLQPCGLTGDFLVKIFSWHVPSSNMAIPVPQPCNPSQVQVVSAYTLSFQKPHNVKFLPSTVSSVCPLVSNDKGGKLTMGQFPHPLVTPWHFLSIKNYTKRTSRPMGSSATLALTTKVCSSVLTF